MVATGGHANGTMAMTAVRDAVRVPVREWPPRTRPERVIVDTRPSPEATPVRPRERGIPATIPERGDRIGHR